MRIALTGAGGFLGWHVRCAAYASGVACVPVPRAVAADAARLADLLRDVDAVVHCAGVNRGTDAEVTDGNVVAARQLARALSQMAGPPRAVYANSVQSRTDTVYGRAKRAAAGLLAGYDHSDVILPNLFGEHGRPHYNSFVATFCHEIAAGRDPVVRQDREVPLLHAQEAARVLLAEAGATGPRVVEPKATTLSVSEVRRMLLDFDSIYRDGTLPDLDDPLAARMFNTLRSYLFALRPGRPMASHVDIRGALTECVCTEGGGQANVSTTEPGQVRGEHVHLRKFERFVVLRGAAEIALRRMFTRDVVRIQVDGDRPSIVDIPTLWFHRLTAVGPTPAVTFFWSSERYRPGDSDTYPGRVDGGEASES
jgi:UDP-2-acetamido-2,6-beta-L-arabino-hexul-4-ose reductase